MFHLTKEQYQAYIDKTSKDTKYAKFLSLQILKDKLDRHLVYRFRFKDPDAAIQEIREMADLILPRDEHYFHQETLREYKLIIPIRIKALYTEWEWLHKIPEEDFNWLLPVFVKATNEDVYDYQDPIKKDTIDRSGLADFLYNNLGSDLGISYREIYMITKIKGHPYEKFIEELESSTLNAERYD